MKMWVYVVIGFLLIILVQNVGVYTVKGDIEGGEPTGFTEAEAMVDGETLRTIRKGLSDIGERMDELDKRIMVNFNSMMNDVLAGKYEEDNYFSNLHEPINETIDYSKEVSFDNFRESVQIIKDRWSGDEEHGALEVGSDEMLKSITAMEQEIERLNGFWDNEAGGVLLGVELFKPCAEELFASIVGTPNLLDDQVNIMENKIDYFLTGVAAKMWDKIQKGKKPAAWSMYKRVIRKSLIMIKDKETFDVEKVLREAEKKYSDKEPIRLLYAHVLLINWHKPQSLEAGYKYLKKAYENLETETLAYNLTRVALRLDKFRAHKGELLKMLDHANHNGKDKNTLGDLNDLLLYAYLKEGSFDAAGDHLKELRDKYRLSRYVSPVYKFIIYLKQGSFELIADDVASHDPSGLAKGLYDDITNAGKEK